MKKAFEKNIRRITHFFSITLVGFCVLFFSGCATFTAFTEGVASAFNHVKEAIIGESDSESTETDNPKTKISVNSSFQSKGRTSKVYKIPENYDSAYSYRTDKPDKTIQTFIKQKNIDSLRTTNPNEYVRSVCAKINETSSNDFERVKKAHDVICLLISYDAKNFWAGTVPRQDWQNVIKSKTAVCEGYANLFQQFCRELKISSQKVTGFSRGVGNDIETENPSKSNHAWNIVCIESEWYLIDCTWDSGYMSGRQSVQSYTTDWLFLKPEHFICTHFPSDESFQLIQKPISITEFLMLPDFRPKLFEYAGESLSHIKKITQLEDSLVLNYNLKSGYVFDFSISKKGSSQINNRVFTENNDENSTTIMNFPGEGVYTVMIFYHKSGEAQGTSCGQFLVKASSGNNIKYPTLYNTSSNNVCLREPKICPLKGGSTIHFDVHQEGKKCAAVIFGNNFIQLENDGNGNFSGNVDIPSGIKSVSIGFASTPSGRYEMFAVYEVK